MSVDYIVGLLLNGTTPKLKPAASIRHGLNRRPHRFVDACIGMVTLFLFYFFHSVTFYEDLSISHLSLRERHKPCPFQFVFKRLYNKDLECATI